MSKDDAQQPIHAIDSRRAGGLVGCSLERRSGLDRRRPRAIAMVTLAGDHPARYVCPEDGGRRGGAKVEPEFVDRGFVQRPSCRRGGVGDDLAEVVAHRDGVGSVRCCGSVSSRRGRWSR